MIADEIWILTAFSVVPQNFLILITAKLQIQIVAHEKLLLIDYVSTISKTDLPAFTGQ